MAAIYLISPPKIDLEQFASRLENSLKTGLISVFQLRLKGYQEAEIEKISIKIKEICDRFNTLFIINDYVDIAFKIGASGVHLGVDDELISNVRKKAPENFIIGASCYDSKDLVMKAGEQGADYISFGAFFESKTKKSRGKPTIDLIKWCDEIINLQIVTIGGINDENCLELVKSGADFIAVISYVWNYEDGEVEAIKKLDLAMKNI